MVDAVRPGTVHATFAVREGALQIGDPITTSSVSVTVDADSFASGSARRDKDVRSARLLDAATYPDITFTAERVRETGDGLVVSGTISAHGHDVPVELQVDDPTHDGSGIRVHGRVQHLDRTAFGITGSRGMVGRHLDLELDAFADPA